ncbi:hypothetical protein KDL01_10105 [Actinospica durhamensis]|uniref:Uncharacterized protein n=1 Tax=Actinospica durhamensis TaxID=1508375 RepID=A0A941EMH3_9ACTN|nr:hypothetical protein [Actinospica durhamensis]MBR7833618.1 hypothetical protein [Actinospica durhamensis]
MRLPVLRRIVGTHAPAEAVIHYEVLDAESGALLSWGSTTSLDTVVEHATNARGDLAGRRTHVRRLTAPSRASAAAWPEPTGTADLTHVNRVRSALTDLRHAVEDAYAAGVDSDLLRHAADPDLTAIRDLLTGTGLFDLPTWKLGYPGNLDRAAWAARSLAVFGHGTGQLRDGERADAELVAEMSGDLVCDLMHLLDHVGVDAYATIQRGIGHHDHEAAEEADNANALEHAA